MITQKDHVVSSLSGRSLWYLRHAEALLGYAQSDSEWAGRLAETVRGQHWQTFDFNRPNMIGTRHLAPTEPASAERLALWFMSSEDDTATAPARSRLATWASTRDTPQAVVLGIIGLAFPFIDLGLIKKRKKSKSRLKLVISDLWYKKQTRGAVGSFTQARCLEQLSRELRMVFGKTDRLHPETFDWLNDDRECGLYLARPEVARQILSAAEQEELCHHPTFLKTELLSVTLSPQVNDLFLPQFDLKRVD